LVGFVVPLHFSFHYIKHADPSTATGSDGNQFHQRVGTIAPSVDDGDLDQGKEDAEECHFIPPPMEMGIAEQHRHLADSY
jgi:hypothetical protein